MFLPPVLSLLTSFAHAGDPCVNLEHVTDKFSDNVPIDMIEDVNTFLTYDDARGPMMFTILAVGGIQQDSLPAGFQLHWLLADGTKITFVSNAPADPASASFATQYTVGTVTGWVLAFPLTPEVVHAVAQSGPSSVRYDIKGTVDFDYVHRRSMALQRDFACLANTLPAQKEAPADTAKPPTEPPAGTADEPAAVASADKPATATPPASGTGSSDAPADTATTAEPVADAGDGELEGFAKKQKPPKDTSHDDVAGHGGAKLTAAPFLWGGAAVTGLVAVGMFGDAVHQRGVFLDEPSEDGFKATNNAYWTSVGFALAGVGCAGLAVSGVF